MVVAVVRSTVEVVVVVRNKLVVVARNKVAAAVQAVEAVNDDGDDDVDVDVLYRGWSSLLLLCDDDGRGDGGDHVHAVDSNSLQGTIKLISNISHKISLLYV